MAFDGDWGEIAKNKPDEMGGVQMGKLKSLIFQKANEYAGFRI